jgi:hypothetical protein
MFLLALYDRQLYLDHGTEALPNWRKTVVRINVLFLLFLLGRAKAELRMLLVMAV